MSRPVQPDGAEVLANGLTCHEIGNVVLATSASSMWAYHTIIDDDRLIERLVATNKRTGFSARYGQEEFRSDIPNAQGLFGTVTQFHCELHIGNVYIYGDWVVDNTSDSDFDRAKKLAQESFIKAAAMIGKRVEHQLVVVEDDD